MKYVHWKEPCMPKWLNILSLLVQFGVSLPSGATIVSCQNLALNAFNGPEMT